MTSITLRPESLRLPRIARERLLPRVSILDAAAVAAIVLVAAVSHGINLFDFPYYHDDEGIYMAQAWAVATQGELAPYTYWYDHAPMGWILIAAWTLLTGGFSTFGTAVESGRVLMLLMHIGSTLLVLAIVRAITGKMWVAVLAALLFTLNGYGLFWQRRVMLDNIASFWMLVSIALLVIGRPSLKRVWLSAVALGISVLSKEVTVFLIPGMSLLAYYRVHRVQRWFAAIGWPAVAASLVSLYLLFAALKGELFPTGTFLGGTTEHVSLFGTLAWQAARGKDAGILQSDSQFWNIVTGNWVVYEPLLVAGGTLAAFGLLLFIRRDVRLAVLGILTLSLWAFMARGGIVYDQYLLPLVPLLAMTVAIAVWLLASAFGALIARVAAGRRRDRRGQFGSLAAAGLGLVGAALVLPTLATGYGNINFGAGGQALSHWSGRQAVGQRAALAWVTDNLPTSSAIVMDASFYVDLHDLPNDGFPLAHHYFKVDLDPEVRDGVFDGSWGNVDYVIADATLKHQAEWDNLTIVLEAINHSSPIISWDTGWPIEVRRVDRTHQVEAQTHPLLNEISRVALGDDLAEPDITAVQALYANDRDAFDRIVAEMPAAASFSPELTLAMVVAADRWPSPERQRASEAALASLWATVESSGRLQLPGWDSSEGLWVDVDRLAPAVYRALALLDPDRDWRLVATSTYALLGQLETDDPATWTVSRAFVDEGRVVDAFGATGGEVSRLPLHVALDWLWHGERRARVALAGLAQAEADDLVATAPKGDLTRQLETIAYRHLPAMLAAGREEDAARLFASRILSPAASDTVDDVGARARQAMWFAVALMDGSLADLADGERVIDWQRAMVVAGPR